LYAQSRYKDLLATNDNVSKYKTSTKKNKTGSTKLAILGEKEILEPQKEIESWMLGITLEINRYTKYRQFEEWMFDEYFWKTKKHEWDEEIIEEPREIEDWMMHLSIKSIGCASINTDLKEREWMKKNAFLIL
ncbi:MAG: hypothetical protein C0597_01455, partial [Marinilabiliales bacterium]